MSKAHYDEETGLFIEDHPKQKMVKAYFTSPAVEEFVCGRLGLTPEPASTQVTARDRHAEFLSTLALMGAGLERFATEIRHLQRSEVGEVQEAFAKGQKGSSAMPFSLRGFDILRSKKSR